jgi:hypothetical protein
MVLNVDQKANEVMYHTVSKLVNSVFEQISSWAGAGPTLGTANKLVYSRTCTGYYKLMKTHQDIDDRSLAMARAIVKKIDADPERKGLEIARSVCRRWSLRRSSAAVAEWLEILEKPWAEIRSILLDESERGKRLRQSSPFGSILSNKERWQIYRKFQKHDKN